MENIKSTASAAASAVKSTLTSVPPSDAYLPWDAPGVETVQLDEREKAENIADAMNRLQKHNFDQHRHAFRATHLKTQAIVKGTVTIPSTLPQHLQQGLFAHPGSYPCIARYANEPVFLQPDTAPGPRGMGLKIFDTPTSERRIAGQDGNEELRTQDFTFNNAPMLELTDIDTTLEIMQLRERYFDSPMKLSAATKLRTDALKQSAPAMLPNTHIISMPMFTQSAFRFGKHYGHLGLFPISHSQTKPEIAQRSVPSDAPPTILSDWLVQYFADNHAEYEFKIQLGTDPSLHPTEDASVVWDEQTAPWQSIGRVTFERQEGVMKPERRVKWEEGVRLSPWRCLEAHRPLGSVNRLRCYVYGRSQKLRGKLNVTQPKDIQSADDLP